MQHYISDSIYGLTLAWVTSETSTKQLECRLDLLSLVWTPSPPTDLTAPVSGVDCLSSCPVANSRQLLSPTNSLLASRYLFRPRRDFKSKNPLSGFTSKQTKESSAWRATYIVLQQISTLMLHSVRFRRVFMCSFVSGGVVICLTDVPTISKGRYHVN